MLHGGDDEKEPPTCLCGQAQAGHGEIEGDLVQGTDVGTLVFSSARAVRSFDRLRVGARRGDAGEATHCGEVLHADRARGGRLFVSARKQVAGPEDYATDPDLRKWAHKAGSAYMCAQNVRASCAACPPPDRRARNTVHSDEEGGVRQPWEPLKAFQRTY